MLGKNNRIMDLITLAIPVYNVESYIEKALLSALNQSYGNMEILIVDDKGCDKSMSIVCDIISNHPRGNIVRIIDHGFNKGTGATKNTAIDCAKGRFLYFMDGDDEILPNCIELLYSRIIQCNVDFVASSHMEISSGVEKVVAYPTTRVIDKNDVPLERKSLMMFTWNKLYKLSFLRNNNIRCVPSHLNEDDLFTFQILLVTKSYLLIEDITYRYYFRLNSTSDKMYQALNSKDIAGRFAKQFAEISILKKRMLLKSENSFFFIDGSFLYDVMSVDMKRSYAILRYLNLPIKRRFFYFSVYLHYPISLKKIKIIRNHKSNHYLFAILSNLPFIFQLFFVCFYNIIYKHLLMNK